jgi:hypothetical protein
MSPSRSISKVRIFSDSSGMWLLREDDEGWIADLRILAYRTQMQEVMSVNL